MNDDEEKEVSWETNELADWIINDEGLLDMAREAIGYAEGRRAGEALKRAFEEFPGIDWLKEQIGDVSLIDWTQLVEIADL